MKTINLKREDDETYAIPMGADKYSYGLRIYLCEDDCEKLGITKAVRAGSQVRLQAVGVVVSSTESVESDGDDKGNDVSLSIQITDLGVEVQGVLRNAAAELYGSN